MYRRLQFVRSAPCGARGPLRGSAARRGGTDRVYLCGFATWPGTTCSKRQPSPREQTPRCANWKQAWRGAPFDLKELPLPDVLLKEWIAFLDAVTVCNTDDAAHPCR